MTSSSDKSESSSIVQQKPINIVVESAISSVTLLADGQHFVSGEKNGKIRCWRMEDGEEVGAPIDAESAVRHLATSQDGKWIGAGTESGRVTVWDAESRKKLRGFTWREKGANSVDISSDGTKIAIAWDDKKIIVNSLPDGKFLWGRKGSDFHTVKFSPDGLFLLVVLSAGSHPNFSASTTFRANSWAVLGSLPGQLPGPATANSSLPCLPMATSTVLIRTPG